MSKALIQKSPNKANKTLSTKTNIANYNNTL